VKKTIALVLLAAILVGILASCANPPTEEEYVLPYDYSYLNEEETVQPEGYERFVGIWQGYAILTWRTLVVLDVLGDEMTFMFVNMWHADGESPPTASNIYTLPIVDGQIVIEEERVETLGETFTYTETLVFYDDHIRILGHTYILESGNEYQIIWTLSRRTGATLPCRKMRNV